MLKYLCSLRCSLSPLFFFLIFTNSLGDSRLYKALPHLSIPNFVIRFCTGVLLHALIFMKASALLLPIVRQASSTSHRISPCPSFLLLLEFAAATSDLRGCGSSQLVKLRRWALWWSYVQSASVFFPEVRIHGQSICYPVTNFLFTLLLASTKQSISLNSHPWTERSSSVFPPAREALWFGGHHRPSPSCRHAH